MPVSKIAFLVPFAVLGLGAAARPAAADVAFSAHITLGGGGAVGVRQQLAPYGRWVTTPSQGSLFVPYDASFVPYSRGSWGGSGGAQVWVSSSPLGQVTEHYGRWMNTGDGWCWEPGDRYSSGYRESIDLRRRYPDAYARRMEDAERRAEDAERRAEDAERRREQAFGIDNPYAEQARRDAQAERRAQQQQRRYEQMMRRGGYGADPAADRRDRERAMRDLERQRRADAAARRDGFFSYR